MRVRLKGNLTSIKKNMLAELEALYEQVPDSSCDFFPRALAERAAGITAAINREVAVFLSRRGEVLEVAVGDASTVSLPEITGRGARRRDTRFSGVRCLHTHPGGDARPSDPDISSMLSLRLDAMITVGVSRNGGITGVYVVLPAAASAPATAPAAPKYHIAGPLGPESREFEAIADSILEAERRAARVMPSSRPTGTGREKVVLVGVNTGGNTALIDELEELALTAGAEVVGKIVQKGVKLNAASLIGSGKAREIAFECQNKGADAVIFDDELSGAQIRNLQEMTGVKVLDRSLLILDIFAGRARSNEGKLQVEIAQLTHRLSLLTGRGVELSRLGGGIGTRGPGESKLETDRRHIRRRIESLERELAKLSKNRDLQRQARRRNAIPTAALVGYTNTGKSTLLNKLCSADVFAEDALFATLDPTTRALTFPGENGRVKMLLTDTVGFIRKLPHELIDAFKSTLEEAVFADVLIHVADLSSEDLEAQIQAVDSLLESLGAANKPTILALNKTDLVPEGRGRPFIPYKKNDAEFAVVEISAKTGRNLDLLVETLRRLAGL